MALFTVEELREVISVKVLAGDAPGWTKQRIRRSLRTQSVGIARKRRDLIIATTATLAGLHLHANGSSRSYVLCVGGQDLNGQLNGHDLTMRVSA